MSEEFSTKEVREMEFEEECPQSCVARYREMAERAQWFAESCRFPEVRDQYLRLAQQWRTPADNADQQA